MICYACSDPATKKYNKKPVCDECYDELAHGIINNKNIHFFGPTKKNKIEKEEDDPGQSNAIRIMEDG
jgi:hypothetical protein